MIFLEGNMFGLGVWEIIVIGVACLVFIGPDKLPATARKAAQTLGDMRRTADSFRAELMSDKIIEVEPDEGVVARDMTEHVTESHGVKRDDLS